MATCSGDVIYHPDANMSLHLYAGMRERLLGDPGFPVKLSIELGIGITMKLLAEFNKRGDNFSNELDFVFANVVMAIIADTMLVWLPAPRAILSSQASSKQRSALQQWLKSCPDNAFQVGLHTTWQHSMTARSRHEFCSVHLLPQVPSCLCESVDVVKAYTQQRLWESAAVSNIAIVAVPMQVLICDQCRSAMPTVCLFGVAQAAQI